MKKISEKIVYEGKWLKLKEISLVNNNDRHFVWESVEIKNTTSSVIVIPMLMPSQRYVMLKQYRAAVDAYVIGFPAGLAHTENFGEEALRELKEETGYTGVVKEVSPMLKINSGIMDSSIRMVTVEIDENDPVNQNVIQELEVSEEIYVYQVPKDKMREFIDERIQEGCDIAAGVWNCFFLN